MKLSGDQRGVIEYDCNVCGQYNRERADRFHRELTACVSCGSNPRFRGVVHALCCGIFGRSLALSDAPTDVPISGIGFSDSECYAQRLKQVFAYLNTHLDAQPQLDITDRGSCERYLPADFVVCTDVFQHIAPPVQAAFDHLRTLLRPGGLLVFSAPTAATAETVEHFPSFHRASIVKLGSAHVLVNLTRDGRLETFQDLLFRGAPGAALEMRVFGEGRLLQHLRDASFTDIRVYSDPVPEVGYYWGDIPHDMKSIGNILGYVLTARAA